MISVVCVFNNKEKLETYLLKSLKTQTVKYEQILIDNTDGQFKSAAEALNFGGNKASSKYIMFVHQDIDLLSNAFLENAEKELDGLSLLGIAGVAGASEHIKAVVSNIENGVPPTYITNVKIDKPTIAQTVDECLIIIPKFIFDKIGFDEKLKDHWHLYAVDYSLTVKEQGYNVYVLPLHIYHLSNGIPPKNIIKRIKDLSILDKNYFVTLKKVLKKHRAQFPKIYTTCGTWYANVPLFLQKIYSFPIYKQISLYKILKKLRIKLI